MWVLYVWVVMCTCVWTVCLSVSGCAGIHWGNLLKLGGKVTVITITIINIFNKIF